MEEHELEQLQRHPEWAQVLNVYQQLEQDARQQHPEFDGWVSRVHEVPGVEATDLPGIHGKLIAFGFLKFDLAGRDGGIRYQLTQLASNENGEGDSGPKEPKPKSKAPRLKVAKELAPTVS